ncbi:MAG: AAA family ATPase, partial [Pseudomonadota bacterium]|nr:AAA family ATPase [Pseudomonadota bacterium]
VKGIENEFVGHALVFGKFMPPTNGHLFLIDFAKASSRKVTILVCSLPSEPIPGEERYKWIKKLYPDCNVVHHAVEIPQYPEEAPDFFNIWKDSIHRHCPGEKFDAIFASEPYGYDMANIMGLRFIPVNTRRDIVPITGTEMRNQPMKHWDQLNPVIRPYFAKRVAIIGPEHCGKTALSQALSERFKTVMVGDYAEILVDDYQTNIPDYDRESMLNVGDVSTVARGQLASMEALLPQCNKVIFSDTELITTMQRSKKLFGEVPDWVEDLSYSQEYHLYLLIKPSSQADKETVSSYKWLRGEMIRRNLSFVEIHAEKPEAMCDQAFPHVAELIS